MSFTQPIWLLVLPLAAGIAVWLMSRRRGAEADVPFVDFWRAARPPTTAGPSWRWRSLPGATILALLAASAAAIAAAGLRMDGLDPPGRGLLVIVDRGIGMSATAGGKPRYLAAAEALTAALRSRGVARLPIRLVVVPPVQDQGGFLDTHASDWLDHLSRVPPTALDTTAAVEAAVWEALRDAEGRPVVAIGHPDVSADADARLFSYPVPPADDDVGIDHFSVVDSPAAGDAPNRRDAMVAARNASPAERAVRVTVHVGSGGAAAETTITVAARTVKSAFLPLPLDGSTWLEARVVQHDVAAPDAQPANDAAWLVLSRAWPQVEPRGVLPEEVLRAIEVYRRHRPADDRSPTVHVASAGGEAGSPGASVTVPGAPVDGSPWPPGAEVQVTADWLPLSPRDLAPAATDGTIVLPPGDADAWRPVVTVGRVPVVAETLATPRRVWVGLRSPALARTPAFVVLWSAILDSFAVHNAGGWRSEPLRSSTARHARLTPAADEVEVSPGVYRNADGSLVAVNASPPAPAADEPFDPEASATTGDLARMLELASAPPAGRSVHRTIAGRAAAGMALLLTVSALAAGAFASRHGGGARPPASA